MFLILKHVLFSFPVNGQKNGNSPPSSASSEKNTLNNAVSKGDINISTLSPDPTKSAANIEGGHGSQSDNQNSSNSNDQQTSNSCDKMTSSEKNVRFSESKNTGNISQEGETTAAEE